MIISFSYHTHVWTQLCVAANETCDCSLKLRFNNINMWLYVAFIITHCVGQLWCNNIHVGLYAFQSIHVCGQVVRRHQHYVSLINISFSCVVYKLQSLHSDQQPCLIGINTSWWQSNKLSKSVERIYAHGPLLYDCVFGCNWVIDIDRHLWR